MPPKSVLLVEDNQSCAKFFKMVLEDVLCLEVHWVSNGIVALDFLNSAKPDLIHMDIQLPDMSGWRSSK